MMCLPSLQIGRGNREKLGRPCLQLGGLSNSHVGMLEQEQEGGGLQGPSDPPPHRSRSKRVPFGTIYACFGTRHDFAQNVWFWTPSLPPKRYRPKSLKSSGDYPRLSIGRYFVKLTRTELHLDKWEVVDGGRLERPGWILI